jgi:hypothetical protein
MAWPPYTAIANPDCVPNATGVEFDIDKAKIKFNILGEKEAEDGVKKIELIVFAYQEDAVELRVKQ